MTPREALGLTGLVFLAVFVVSIVVLNRWGRRLALRLNDQQPELYERLGRPLPTTLPSERRLRFDEFIMRRNYERLPDGDLADRFARLRLIQTRLLGGAIVILLGLAVGVFVVD